jgi:integrase
MSSQIIPLKGRTDFRESGQVSGHRDHSLATMILIAYRHGLRASEVRDLQWHQVELAAGRLHVRRSKRGTPSVHPMPGRRDSRSAPPAAREGPELLRLRLRARRLDSTQELRDVVHTPRRARRYGLSHPPAHASARLRLRAGQRRIPQPTSNFQIRALATGDGGRKFRSPPRSGCTPRIELLGISRHRRQARS